MPVSYIMNKTVSISSKEEQKLKTEAHISVSEIYSSFLHLIIIRISVWKF
jgi:hypothetical protein